MKETSEDIVIPEIPMIVDVKSTIGKKQITIKREPLEKILETAEKREQLGGIVFSFKHSRNQYMILKLEDFFEIITGEKN